MHAKVAWGFLQSFNQRFKDVVVQLSTGDCCLDAVFPGDLHKESAMLPHSVPDMGTAIPRIRNTIETSHRKLCLYGITPLDQNGLAIGTAMKEKVPKHPTCYAKYQAIEKEWINITNALGRMVWVALKSSMPTAAFLGPGSETRGSRLSQLQLLRIGKGNMSSAGRKRATALGFQLNSCVTP